MKKIVPIVLRRQKQQLDILVFKHPLAGIQLVKGTIERDEHHQNAAIRELFEESGLIAEPNPKFIGNFQIKFNQQNWYFYLCKVSADLAETWTHHCQDGGGLDFEFFWFSLNQKPNADWHETFLEALGFIRRYFSLEK
ncbi:MULTISPECIES: NUDIX domain-containing protein [Acinetobacter]|jgi:8-oxo-dGTP pyrophosphatase MutT (NUDIX family)|uniref:NUDIX hydrolase n=1 Tax=Acinetobacter TaxID=469 RepID=UPI000C664DF4|nr:MULTISPECIES: NUDIX domain-containing protein [Acinetobacter]MBC68149.1 DNA mismatch repair protein MutT [Acinetobacter sp.]MBT50305.1 DNA mismatch repair protein MutT [Acinetobacter sp.]HIQ35732.1 NUDIX domain-containing protein [Acinetobacter venetianus]HJP47388.1 NUDIX domain-containing protein [Acinetobacter venetianus]|tara:strand:- start:2476 stop:2889 length:414 start_codon:yes stop_codon:yes gene_type:complete